MGLVGILIGIGNGNIIWFGFGFGFNYNSNHNCNSRGGQSIGIGIGNGNIIRFGMDSGGVCTGILYSFGCDNRKRRMSRSCIWMGLVTGVLYVLVRILEGAPSNMLVTGILFTFAIIIVTVVVVVGEI